MKATETRLPESRCPLCGYKIDAASSFEGKSPKPGDISVCLKCASPLVFAADLTIRAMSDEEFAALHPQNQTMLHRYMQAVRQLDWRKLP